ncbi:MAG: hypothetical protein KDN05_15720 [Verrucomicrobiae bacterium]|nr:hypothetical protein [Verrucomicrobiae bacterium]MCP5534177.1 hypothetical protein [Akkermansiaceae bacterium]MCP5543801.1 hypothetical protein [Akkermansiaceae bacterium]MCP5546530.1 hypothetical protein [Akkermansiaceae bacterium]
MNTLFVFRNQLVAFLRNHHSALVGRRLRPKRCAAVQLEFPWVAKK